jgi:hypothetical protein
MAFSINWFCDLSAASKAGMPSIYVWIQRPPTLLVM